MIRRVLPILICAAAARAESAWPNGLTVTFNGGTALEIHTESTLANSPLSTSGSVAISDRNEVSRTVVDKQGRLLFTYDIEAAPEGSSQRYTIRIKPHDPARIDLNSFTFAPGDQFTLDGSAYTVRSDGTVGLGDLRASGLTPDRLSAAIRERGLSRGPGKVVPTRRELPTVAAVREFKNVRIGEAVSIDILMNPSTGERIFDVIQPLPPGPKGMQGGNMPPQPKPEDEFSLKQARIAINGKTIENPGNSWMIGGAFKIALPHHGTVYIAINPVTSHAFQPVGRVERGKMTFPLGADFVEIFSAEDILKRSPRNIWIYWDQSAPNTETVDVTCSGTIESLLPKK